MEDLQHLLLRLRLRGLLAALVVGGDPLEPRLHEHEVREQELGVHRLRVPHGVGRAKARVEHVA